MKIRTAGSVSDARRIAEIKMSSWQAAYRGIFPEDYLGRLDADAETRLWVRFLTRPEAPIWVAEEEGLLVGFCHLMPARDEDARDFAEIVALYLVPTKWGCGIGRDLARAAMRDARERGFRGVNLWVLEENLRAREFYKAIGFQADGLMKTEKIGGTIVREIRYRLSFD